MLWCVADVGFGTARLSQSRMYVGLTRRTLLLMIGRLLRETLRWLGCGSEESSLFFTSFE